MRKNLGLMAAAALAAAGAATTAASVVRPTSPRAAYGAGFNVDGGQPYRGTAGMAHGTKTRGNRAVVRAAAKKRNQQRHRQACRG